MDDRSLDLLFSKKDLIFILLDKKERILLKKILKLSPNLIHQLDDDGNDPLLYICLNVSGCRHRIIEFLIQMGADLQRRNRVFLRGAAGLAPARWLEHSGESRHVVGTQSFSSQLYPLRRIQLSRFLAGTNLGKNSLGPLCRMDREHEAGPAQFQWSDRIHQAAFYP